MLKIINYPQKNEFPGNDLAETYFFFLRKKKEKSISVAESTVS